MIPTELHGVEMIDHLRPLDPALDRDRAVLLVEREHYRLRPDGHCPSVWCTVEQPRRVAPERRSEVVTLGLLLARPPGLPATLARGQTVKEWRRGARGVGWGGELRRSTAQEALPPQYP